MYKCLDLDPFFFFDSLGDGDGFATGERLLVLEDPQDGPVQAREEEAGGGQICRRQVIHRCTYTTLACLLATSRQ